METIIKREKEIPQEINGVLVDIEKDVEYIRETIPQKIVETPKKEKISQLESSLKFYISEVARNQEMVDGLQLELDAIK